MLSGGALLVKNCEFVKTIKQAVTNWPKNKAVLNGLDYVFCCIGKLSPQNSKQNRLAEEFFNNKHIKITDTTLNCNYYWNRNVRNSSRDVGSNFVCLPGIDLSLSWNEYGEKKTDIASKKTHPQCSQVH